MFLSLPDECKQLLWQCFDAVTLCRVTCVSVRVDQGVALAPLWKRHAVEMARREVARIETERLPVDGGALQRQNATRRLASDLSTDTSRATSTRESLSQHDEARRDEDEEAQISSGADAGWWRVWYRDFHLAMRRFDAAHVAFDAAKNELQTLKRQRSDLRDLLQATKNASQSGDKQLRRLQMNCVRWLNRTSRRAAAAAAATQAKSTTLSKSQVADELQSIESSIQWQSKLIFKVRSQYQKALHQRTRQVASGKRLLAELDGSESNVQ